MLVLHAEFVKWENAINDAPTARLARLRPVLVEAKLRIGDT
jgi:hypothetical protein